MRLKPRAWLVRLHRWAGLGCALFLVLMGLTGALLAFEEALDAWLNPDLFHVAVAPGTPLMDPLVLQRQVQAALPGVNVDVLRLRLNEGQALKVAARRPGVDLDPFRFEEAFFDPHSGRLIGSRLWGAVPTDRRGIVPFIYRLHRSLALPVKWGVLILGVVSLVWTIDCFIGLALTLPRRAASAGQPVSLRDGLARWWKRWLVAWKIKPGASATRLNFDLHRAGGLWLWGMLLVFGWSSVMLTFRTQVYDPVMHALLRFDEPLRRLPARAPGSQPRLDLAQALQAGRATAPEAARRHGFHIEGEWLVSHARGRGVYVYWLRTDLDIRDNDASTGLIIDDTTGAWRGTVLPRSADAPGNGFTQWMYGLHMAQVWGFPYRVVVFVLGLAVAMLCFTGVWIWWVKRAASSPTARVRAR